MSKDLKDLETVEEVVTRYQRMAEMKPDIFVKYTWDDLTEFSQGYDTNGVIPEYAPDLGVEKWKKVILLLEDSYKTACNRLVKGNFGNTWN